jgi:hypothetical protein
VRRYPVILGWLADGSLNVTTVRLLRPVLKPENHLAVLQEARRRSKKEVELIVRRLDPKPDAPSTIRKAPGRRSWRLRRSCKKRTVRRVLHLLCPLHRHRCRREEEAGRGDQTEAPARNRRWLP